MKIVLKILETLVSVPLILVGCILISPFILLAKLLELIIGVIKDIWSYENEEI